MTFKRKMSHYDFHDEMLQAEGTERLEKHVHSPWWRVGNMQRAHRCSELCIGQCPSSSLHRRKAREALTLAVTARSVAGVIDGRDNRLIERSKNASPRELDGSHSKRRVLSATLRARDLSLSGRGKMRRGGDERRMRRGAESSDQLASAGPLKRGSTSGMLPCAIAE